MRDEELEQMDERMQSDGMIDRATGTANQSKIELPHADGKGRGERRMGDRDPKGGEKNRPSVDTRVEAAEEMVDPALARKLAEGKEMPREESRDEGSWLGTLAIILSVLSLLLVPFILAPAGIVLGVISGSRRSQLGWWAVGVGIFSLIINLAAAPYLRLY